SSRLFLLGVGYYRDIQYEKAEKQFKATIILDNNFAPAKEYLEKTEYILGKKQAVSPELSLNLSAAEENPIYLIYIRAADLLTRGQHLYEEQKYEAALIKFEAVQKEILWLAPELVNEQCAKLREKANLLSEDCLTNLFPRRAGELKILFRDREDAAQSLKKALDDLIKEENIFIERARDTIRTRKESAVKSFELAKKLAEEQQYQKSKEFLIHALSLDPSHEESKILLKEVEKLLKEGDK
ncbi:MAG: hypothetical protein ABIH42_04145, partial [Planctomycetota bacterium]